MSDSHDGGLDDVRRKRKALVDAWLDEVEERLWAEVGIGRDKLAAAPPAPGAAAGVGVDELREAVDAGQHYVDGDWPPPTPRETETLVEAGRALLARPPQAEPQGRHRATLEMIYERACEFGWTDVQRIFEEALECVFCGQDECECLEAIAVPQAAPQGGVDAAITRDESLLAWAISKWHDEVANRPLQNVHRRALDGTWRQVVRYAGGNDEELLGPRHDDALLARRQEGS
jgi:hypothetical protein